MKRLLLTLLLVVPFILAAFSQDPGEKKYGANELKGDLAYLKDQLYTVHIDPFSELTKSRYDRLFANINNQITDSLTATAFLRLIKPVIAYLSDEHAQAFLPDKLLVKSYRDSSVFLPFNLSKKNGVYRVNKILSPQADLTAGEVITAIDGMPVDSVLKRCALFLSGYPDQRDEKTLHEFGYLYAWSRPNVRNIYNIKTGGGKVISIEGITLKKWQLELNTQTGWDASCDERISYQKIGDAGYITACSFSVPQRQLDSIRTHINTIFDRVQKDSLKYLFIDLSKNSGGQSKVGSMLIDCFYGKPYLGFNCDFKKSEAYVKLLRSWKVEPDDYYKNAPEGKIFHFASDTIYTSKNKPNRYNGKVYIIVGNGTFSSAMMMATWIKDNNIATIAGETPVNGHPNGFGELYQTKLPSTNIVVLFGVKRWIRPSGNLNDNSLKPDVEVALTDDKPMLIESILIKSN